MNTTPHAVSAVPPAALTLVAPASPPPPDKSMDQDSHEVLLDISKDRYYHVTMLFFELLELYGSAEEALKAHQHYRKTGTFPEPKSAVPAGRQNDIRQVCR